MLPARLSESDLFAKSCILIGSNVIGGPWRESEQRSEQRHPCRKRDSGESRVRLRVRVLIPWFDPQNGFCHAKGWGCCQELSKCLHTRAIRQLCISLMMMR
jgi:hypothetical protein